eukprot:3947492-Pyramimonas_sp.AAC.1
MPLGPFETLRELPETPPGHLDLRRRPSDRPRGRYWAPSAGSAPGPRRAKLGLGGIWEKCVALTPVVCT